MSNRGLMELSGLWSSKGVLFAPTAHSLRSCVLYLSYVQELVDVLMLSLMSHWCPTVADAFLNILQPLWTEVCCDGLRLAPRHTP
jgi:hypothetical protein